MAGTKLITMPDCFSTGDVVYFPFDATDANGAAVTITGLAVTDIEVYKNGSVTQRASDAGYVLLDTDGIDFDTTTGLHGFSIDTGDDTDAGFWADGNQYWVHVNAITVDAQTVRFTYYLPLGMRNRGFGPRTWYVDASTGDNTNSGLVRSLPKLTVAAAISAASAGDTVRLLGGGYTTAITINKTITVEGDGATITDVTVNNSSQAIAITVGGVTLRKVFATQQGTGKAVSVSSSLYGVTLEQVDGDSLAGDCIDVSGTVGTQIINCVPAASPGNTIDLSSATGFVVDRCSVETTVASDTATDVAGINADLSAVGVIRNSTVSVTRSS